MNLNFNNSRLLVIGDLILDTYLYGNVSRISPEAPVPIFNEINEEARLGGACNVALNLCKLGATVDIIGLTGNDTNAILLKKMLIDHNINEYLITDDDYVTIEKRRLVSNNHQLLRCDKENIPTSSYNTQILKKLENNIFNYDAVILSDYMKGTLSKPQPLINFFRKKLIPVIIDPKGKSFTKYKNASILTPNFKEFEMVVGKCKNEEDIAKKAKRLIKNINLNAVLITRSEKGLSLVTKSKVLNIPTFAKEVFDVTGAGDTIVSVLAASMSIGNSLVDSSILANTAAGIVVGKFGTAYASNNEILSKLYNDDKKTKKINKKDLLNKLALIRQTNKKIVFTNGCFDVIHAGHIDYLQKAKKLGDILIVGLNSDASVSRLKGKDRPINNNNNRKKVLEALECIDHVIIFNEDTPIKLIESIIPDVLVKGGDYSVKQIVGADNVIENGGMVKTIKFYQDLSSSKILNNQRQKK